MSATQCKTNERERWDTSSIEYSWNRAEEAVHSNPGSWYTLHEIGGNKFR